MNIHLYSIVWNEERMLPYFFKHYDQYISKYFISDDDSDDLTREILRSHPRVTLLDSVVDRNNVCHSGQKWKNNAWKQSKGEADLVIVCDVDEFVYHDKNKLIHFLSGEKDNGFCIWCPDGFQMVSETFPSTPGQIYDEVRNGFFDKDYSKSCIFNPNVVEEINYTPGCHDIIRPKPHHKIKVGHGLPLRLLHFKYLGFEYLKDRYRQLRERLGPEDKFLGAAPQYYKGDHYLKVMMEKGTEQIIY